MDQSGEIKEDLKSSNRERILGGLVKVEDILRGREGGAEFLDELTVLLDIADAEVKRAATWSVGKLGQNKAIERAPLDKLNSLLSDPDPDTRENAAWALGPFEANRGPM